MVSLFFNFADATESQYLVYQICINHKTKLMTMSGSWDYWGGFTVPSPTAVCGLRHTRKKTKLKTQASVQNDFFPQKEVLQDHSHFGGIAWIAGATLKITISRNYVLHFALREMKKIWTRKKELWNYADISIFWLMEKSDLFQSNSHEQIPVT